jgi:redox-sensitive bicupin YhaK (pirin superfamily)
VTDLAFPDEVSESDSGSSCPDEPVTERIPWREADLGGGLTVQRALPVRKRRTIGAWCFLDLAGPFSPESHTELDVGPHPHIGLQTVTWLLDGEVRHRDSVGSDQLIRPHELNVMTSGRGIAHSERAPDATPRTTRLAQLWVALPESERGRAPSFEHHDDLPVLRHGELEVELLVGSFDSATSPATTFTPIVGLDIRARTGAASPLMLDRRFEYGVVVLDGAVTLDDEPLAPGELLYLGRGRDRVMVTAEPAAHLLVLGGEPYEDELHMWWNFVGGSREEITQAREEWETGSDRFPDVVGDDGERLTAPPLPWR